MTCDRCGIRVIGGWYRGDGTVVCLTCIREAVLVEPAIDERLHELFHVGPLVPDCRFCTARRRQTA